MSDVTAEWDERYSASDRIWSGNPNGALVAEAVDLAPGRVLDVGCGEGADAVWLAARGWQVTAIDVSGVALTRARQHASDAGVEITWIQAGLLDARLPDAAFDLVSAQYPALLRDASPERTLRDLVAPGGVLLAVFHADVDRAQALEHGFDPDDYVGIEQLVGVLEDTWQVVRDERRPRDIHGGGGAHHTHDTVLRAHRLR